MSKIAQYLQEHLVGEVMASPDVRDYFSTDSSIFRVVPQFVVYPRSEQDVRKTARFVWQLAERGHKMPITARGFGSDLSGAAIGPGIIMVMPAHLNKILALDPAKGVVRVHAGLSLGKLQQTLFTHGRHIPVMPTSYEYTTVGGAIAGNAIGENSTKYGTFSNFIRKIKVVLSNGELIEVEKLSKRDLSKKMGLTSFEGEVYRTLNALLKDNADNVRKSKLNNEFHSAGYNLDAMVDKDGGLNLIPLFAGSQGTLGVVVEAELDTLPYNPKRTLLVCYLDDPQNVAEAIKILKEQDASSIEMINKGALDFANQINPHQLKDLLPEKVPNFVVLAEFDDSERSQKREVKKSNKKLRELSEDVLILKEAEDVEKYWKLRHVSATIMAYGSGTQRALPILTDALVPTDQFANLLASTHDLNMRFGQNMPMWGHAGIGSLSLQPFLDISQVGDRQKIFRLLDEFTSSVLSFGGVISAAGGDGRLRGPYLVKQYPPEVLQLFGEVKRIFDPHNLMNPGVKLSVTIDDVRPLIRQEYKGAHRFEHMPRL